MVQVDLYMADYKRLFFFSCSLLFALNACAPARMALPPEINSGFEHWPVRGRSYFFEESFAFGPYELTNVHRGWTSKSRWGLGTNKVIFFDASAKQKYEFQIREGQRPAFQVQCATNASWTPLELRDVLGKDSTFTWDLTAAASLSCFLTPSAEAAAWILVAQQSSVDGTLNGALSSAARGIRIRSTRELAGSSWPLIEASGYFFEWNGEMSGAVEVINDGQVWIRKGLEPELRHALAASAAALLLYRAVGEW